tara:strand:- start:808 stop:2091 length:1284 start_codon:yes stop_codon:yes gene_type:complete
MKIIKKYKILIFLIVIIFAILVPYKEIYRSLSFENREFIKKILMSEREILLKSLNINQLTLPNTYLTQIHLEKISIPNSYNTLNSANKAVGYIDKYQDWIFFVSGTGKISKIKTIDLLNNKNKFTNVDTNFYDLVKKNELLLSSSKKIKINHKVSVNDILIVDEKIYISFTAKRENCYFNKIVYAELKFDYLNFVNLFNPDQCIAIQDSFSKFNAQAAGGRILKKEGYLYLTTGTFLNNDLAQNNNSIFGKVLEINIENGNYKIFAKGFRNPQGLTEYKNNLILSEHGPYGGDEINKLILNKNYGWNIASYGRKYNASYKNEESFFESHQNYQEPLFAFVPSVGLSQIVPSYNFEKKWKNNLILSSLNGRSIFRLSFDKDFNRLVSFERIFIGERIRDIIYLHDEKKFFLVLEESGSIGIITNKNHL